MHTDPQRLPNGDIAPYFQPKAHLENFPMTFNYINWIFICTDTE